MEICFLANDHDIKTFFLFKIRIYYNLLLILSFNLHFREQQIKYFSYIFSKFSIFFQNFYHFQFFLFAGQSNQVYQSLIFNHHHPSSFIVLFYCFIKILIFVQFIHSFKKSEEKFQDFLLDHLYNNIKLHKIGN